MILSGATISAKSESGAMVTKGYYMIPEAPCQEPYL